MRLGQIECGLEPIVTALDHEGTLSDIDNAGDTSLHLGMGLEGGGCTALAVGARAESHEPYPRHRVSRDGESSDHQSRCHRRRRPDASGDIDRALNLNSDFYLLFLDGDYLTRESGPSFRWAAAPTAARAQFNPGTEGPGLGRSQ